MLGSANKSEGLREKNDTLVVVKADGGLTLAKDVYQEFGELHSDKDSVTIDLQQKIPVLKATILGRPPLQDRTLYYVDEEPLDAGFDPKFMHSKLNAAYSQTISGDTMEAEKERSHKRLKDLVYMGTGAFFLMFALVLAPMMGLQLKAGGEDSPPVRAPIETEQPAETQKPTDGTQQPTEETEQLVVETEPETAPTYEYVLFDSIPAPGGDGAQ